MSFTDSFKEAVAKRIFGKSITFRRAKASGVSDDEGVVKKAKKPVKRVAKKK